MAMTTTVSTAVLKAVPLFSSFPEDALRTLTSMVARKSVSRSTTVMTGGDPTDSLYIVLSGRLKVMMSDSDGKEVILTILGPGEIFGEISFIDKSGASASVVADEDVAIDFMSNDSLEALFAESPDLAVRLYRSVALVLAGRLRETDARLTGKK